MVDLSDDDIFTATTNVVKAIQEQGITRGIVVDVLRKKAGKSGINKNSKPGYRKKKKYNRGGKA